MYKYKIKYSTELLYQLIGITVFILLAFFISRPTAVTDIYVQLLAIKGILSGLNFGGVGGHPLGIPILASLLKLFNFDPLICLYFLQPVLSGLCFCLLFRLLKTELSNKFSFFISLSSLSSLALIRSMNQVTAEIMSLFTILLLMTYIWRNIIQNNNITIRVVLTMIVLSWIVIFFRNAAIFIIIGILIYFLINNIFSKLKLLVISIIILLPGAIKSALFYTQQFHRDKILSINMPKEILTQLTKHFLNLTEIIFPYSLHLNHLPWIKMFIVISCLLIVLLLKKYQKDPAGKENTNKIFLVKYFITIGCSYYCILSFAGVYYNYDWGELYRVSGFGIIFLLNGFWIYMLTFVRWEKYILILLIISSLTKISYGLRYEILSNEYRFLFQDYRKSVKGIIEYVNTEDEDIYVYTEKSGRGRNLYYMLSYYNLIHSLPFEVHAYSDSIRQFPYIVLCSDLDLDQFNNKIYSIDKIPSIGRVFAIKK